MGNFVSEIIIGFKIKSMLKVKDKLCFCISHIRISLMLQ